MRLLGDAILVIVGTFGASCPCRMQNMPTVAGTSVLGVAVLVTVLAF